jgi:flagellar L-ring protein precursor FlgH
LVNAMNDITTKNSAAEFFRMIFLVVSIGSLTACTIGPDAMPNDPAYAPVYPLSAEIPMANSGGIYRPGYSAGLFEDLKARRVGDIISVILSERFDAGTVLGVSPSLGDYNMQTSVTQDRELKGEAGSDQSNSLSGSIAVTIAEILPNGLMMVRGEKWMTLNRGEEFIRIQGLIRPEDVQPDNTILSTRLADARITYSGTGDLANANKQGWGARFFNSEYWPF